VRNFLVLSEESFAYNCQELRRQMYMVDATEETNPIPVAIFKVPDGDFCERGGCFGPHQLAETKDGEIIGGTLLYVAYFNAGLRIVDIAAPYHPREVGFFIPDPVRSAKSRGSRIIQTNDVDLDYRGLIYITDRAGNGLHILEFRGGK
jgi:LVIVD repeat